ncbi:MAG: helix-turn-helix domain-containing protein [Rikenellaceae bacterium]
MHHADGYTLTEMEAEDDVLYVGTRQRGVYSFDTKSRSFEHLKNLPINRVRALHVKNKTIYVNHENFGLVQYDIEQQRITSYIGKDDNHPLTTMSIYCVHADSQGLLWVGSFSNGAYLIQPKNNYISVLPQTESISVRSMWHISDNKFIIGSREGLYLYNNGITKHFTREKYEVMKSNIILSIRPFQGDKYIVGTFKGGAFILDEANQRVEPLAMGQELTELLSKNSIYSTEQVGDDIYFFTLTGMVKYSSVDGVITQWGDQNSIIPSSLLFAHYYDKARNLIWLSTKKGFCKFNITTNSIEHVRLISAADKTPIVNDFRSNMITMDSRGNILLDKDNIELLRYTPETEEFDRINFADNATGHISGVIQDDTSGNMWVATTNDIYAYNEEKSQYVKVMEYCGFPSTNICPNSVLKSPSGQAFVGSEQGLYTFHTQANDTNNQEFHIFMSNITINGSDALPKVFKSSRPDDRGQIIYNINISNTEILQIDVVAPYFTKANNYKYAFRIDNGEWIYAKSNSLKLLDGELSFGNHKIYVMVTPSDNMAWSEPIYVGRIQVLPNMVMILSGVILVLILSVIIYIVMRRLAMGGKQESSPKVAATVLDGGRSEEVIEIIKAALSTNFGFRNPTYRIKDLSDETGIPTTEISQVLNSYFGMNFADFINDYRIEEMKELLLKPDVEQYNLHILSEQCGFNSKASFYRIFKNKTGVTPMQYRKQHITEPSK